MKRDDTKPCVSCGRAITWRKKWERSWDEIKHCSAACRSARPGPTDAAMEKAIIDLLSTRSARDSICPSEAARVVSPEKWNELMERARRAARRLVNAGTIQITQKGKVVDPSTARGPIRLRLSR